MSSNMTNLSNKVHSFWLLMLLINLCIISLMMQDASEYQCESGEAPRYVPHKPITGVIGASFSTESIMVANILRLFKVNPLFLLLLLPFI